MIKKRKLVYTNNKPAIGERQKATKGGKIFIMQSIIFLGGCLLVGWAWGGIFSFVKTIGSNISQVVTQGTMTLIGKTIGTEPKVDENGNVNIGLFGYGGDTHAGGYLTDSIMVISINPKKGTMAMLSLPRDLYVKKPNGSYGKINGVFEAAFYQNDKNYDLAAPAILGKITEITGVPLHYYAFVDFHGFEDFIDSLGGIVIDVPKSLYDSAYPGANNSYTVFSIGSGVQTIGGETALKYARSRHSTSDYDRSMRQQLIIKGIMDKILFADTLLNPTKMEGIYKNITSFVHTNFGLQETLRGLQYAKKINKRSSWQIAACGASRWENTQAGCLLYSPPLETFGGASTQLPVGATPSNISNYTVIQSYVKDIFMNADFLSEGATIRVLNGINTSGENTSLRLVPFANNIAVDLIKAGFSIFDVGNAMTTIPRTTITTNGPGRENAITKIHMRIPNAQVVEGPITPDGPSLTITLGDDYATSGSDTRGNAKPVANIPLYLKY